jgi:acylphosphatase
MKARVHLTIKGRVQGVGFRWYVYDVATDLSLAGWVRNLPGGEVEAVFEGEKKRVEEAVDKCSRGPSSAAVSSVNADWHEKPEGLESFEINY